MSEYSVHSLEEWEKAVYDCDVAYCTEVPEYAVNFTYNGQKVVLVLCEKHMAKLVEKLEDNTLDLDEFLRGEPLK